jgi:hypothetical protein
MSLNKTIDLVKLSTSPYLTCFELEKSVYQINKMKKVKIIKCPDEKSGVSFEDAINQYLFDNLNKIDIIDIKYSDKSCLIIYKLI